MTKTAVIRKQIAAMDTDYRQIRAACKAVLRENEKLRNRNDRMREALVEYYKAETAYEAENSTERYGRYQAASAALVELARQLTKEK